MTGAIAGVTGWAPVDSPDFTTVAKLAGVNLATVNDLSALQTTLENLIDQKVASTFAAYGSTSDVLANTAILTGEFQFTSAGSWSTTQTIPLPTYPDGSTATEAECKWVAFPTWIPMGVGLSGPDIEYLEFRSSGGAALVNPSTTRTFTAGIRNSNGASGTPRPCNVGYIIVARR